MIIKIDCSDTKGLIFNITSVIYDFDLNIINNAEFVDEVTGHFYMRSEVEGSCDTAALKARLVANLAPGTNISIITKKQKDIVLFATKEYQCLGEMILRCIYKDLNARILAVISNREHLRKLVEKYDIPFHFIDHRELGRQEHEAAVNRQLEVYPADFLVLAKYMRILTPAFVARYRNRIINIHHSFLPAFKGANPYRQAFERGVKIIGATAHFVNDDLDEGPIIEQDVIRVDHAFTARAMSQAGKDVEKMVLARAMKLVCDDRVFIHGNKTIIF